jgi:hypothetical protein
VQELVYIQEQRETVEVEQVFKRPHGSGLKSVAKQDIYDFKIEDIELSRAQAWVQQDKEPQEHVVLLLVAYSYRLPSEPATTTTTTDQERVLEAGSKQPPLTFNLSPSQDKEPQGSFFIY